MNKNISDSWEYIIGLEVHAQITSKSKLFSRASTKFGSEPNNNVALFDIASPGVLPVLNEFCVRQAVKTGIAINGTINEYSVFDRKNYFYPDLPSGYQISQFHYPLVKEGGVEISVKNKKKIIRIISMHMEQDTGKSLHDQIPGKSCIDFNRAGTALMEIVSYPDLRSSLEAAEYIKKLRSIMRYLGTCDGDMEKGSLRCDANVSVRKKNEELGTRCEIKNLNSIKNIIKAIEYEAARQIKIIEQGKEIEQETRLFDANTGVTYTMRLKEDAEDYRYFPDPDLRPLYLRQSYIDEIRKTLPELPDDKLKRYIVEYNLTEYDASILVMDKNVAIFFEKLVKDIDGKLAANWIISELFYMLKKHNIDIQNSPISPDNLLELLNLIVNKTISGKMAKRVFERMFETKKSAFVIVKEENLVQITDEKTLLKIIDQVITDHEKIIAGYKEGNKKLFGFLVGQIMKATHGKASPVLVNQLLKDKLS